MWSQFQRCLRRRRLAARVSDLYRGLWLQAMSLPPSQAAVNVAQRAVRLQRLYFRLMGWPYPVETRPR